MQFIYDDGGRAAAGFKGRAGDCVARAIAIATERPYKEVYDALAAGTATERRTRRGGRMSGKRTAREGIHTTRKWFKDYMASLGWRWTPTMQIGSGCKVHLTDGELPSGRLIVALSKHYTAVVYGVVYDTHDPQRRTYWYGEGDYAAGRPARVTERCVYGYWSPALPSARGDEGE